MKTEFSPGPWIAKGRYIGVKNHMSSIGECRDVNGNWSDDAKAHANANLIAAAPDLYAALVDATKEMATCLNDAGDCDHQVGICMCELKGRIHAAERALKKARGEKP